jgi:hypothetical protein
MMYKEHTKEHTRSERQLSWQRRFGEAAEMCSSKVKGLPKGEKVRAYRACMRDTLRKK